MQYKGNTAVRDYFDGFFNNAKDLKGEFVELAVVNDGKLGMARSLQHFTWTDKDGKQQEATLRVTDVFQGSIVAKSGRCGYPPRRKSPPEEADRKP